ncbi:MAG: biotin transporter BioY [Termitinemataceae bacterium]|nr:MAG: biotin transporter BioY [Termitinemataceae bacterium]
MSNTSKSIGSAKAAGLTMTALFAALIACGAFISFPLPVSPVPIVLQNMFAIISGAVLGPLCGAAAVGLFLIAGMLGAPVFAGGTGGFAHFFGPTGGFLLGYMLGAFTTGLIAGTPLAGKKNGMLRMVLACIAGFLIIYVPGVIRLHFIIGGTPAKAIAVGCLPFLPGDAVKVVIALITSHKLRAAAVNIANRF